MNHPPITTPGEWESLGKTLSDRTSEDQAAFLLAFAYGTWDWQRQDLITEIKRSGPHSAGISALRDLAALILEELE